MNISLLWSQIARHGRARLHQQAGNRFAQLLVALQAVEHGGINQVEPPAQGLEINAHFVDRNAVEASFLPEETKRAVKARFF